MLPLFCPALCILNYFLFSVFITKDAKFFTSASLFSHFRKRHPEEQIFHRKTLFYSFNSKVSLMGAWNKFNLILDENARNVSV